MQTLITNVSFKWQPKEKGFEYCTS